MSNDDKRGKVGINVFYYILPVTLISCILQFVVVFIGGCYDWSDKKEIVVIWLSLLPFMTIAFIFALRDIFKKIDKDGKEGGNNE